MTPHAKSFLTLTLPIVALAAVCECAVTYQGLASGTGYPADEPALLELVRKVDVTGLREHGWVLFSELTRVARDGKRPVWETWYTRDQVFGTAPPSPARKLDRTLQVPGEFALLDAPTLTILKNTLRASPRRSIESKIFFNEEAKDHITENQFNTKAELSKWQDHFHNASVSAPDRNITPFPRRAVVLKTIWQVVKTDCSGSISAWSPKDRRCNLPANWKSVNVGPASCGPSFIPLSHFYSFRITKANLAEVENGVANGSVTGGPEVGDAVVLLGMHVTTKEIPNWFWATFWWSDYPQDPMYGFDRPATVQGVWRNYVMDVSFDMVNPTEQELGNIPKICLNPYLEINPATAIPEAPCPSLRPPTSSCMTCHRVSSFPGPSCNPGEQRGAVPVDGNCFDDNLKVDFLWSLRNETSDQAKKLLSGP